MGKDRDRKSERERVPYFYLGPNKYKTDEI